MDWGEFGKNIIGKKMIVLLAVTGAVYFFLQYLTPLLAPVLLAMLFVTIFGPMMKRMNRKLHFPRPLSAIVLLILATLLLAVLLWVLSSWVLGSLPVWIRSMDAREQEWLAMVRDLCHGVGEIIGVDASYLENTVSGRLQEGLDSLEENILPGMLSQSMQYVRWFAEVGGLQIQLVLGCAGKSYITLNSPYTVLTVLLLMILCTGSCCCILSQSCTLNFLHFA